MARTSTTARSAIPDTEPEGPGDTNDKESMNGATLEKLEIHEQSALANRDEARKNFFSESIGVKWEGSIGEYYIRALNKAGENSELEYKWPMAFVGDEPQTINAAMWFKHKNDGYVLASIWTFSSSGDETNQFYNRNYQKDCWAINSDIEELISNPGTLEHFSVSSGDYWADHFYCAPLDVILEQDMAQLQLASTSEPSDKKRRIH